MHDMREKNLSHGDRSPQCIKVDRARLKTSGKRQELRGRSVGKISSVISKLSGPTRPLGQGPRAILGMAGCRSSLIVRVIGHGRAKEDPPGLPLDFDLLDLVPPLSLAAGKYKQH